MKKILLFPTDFSIESLTLVKAASPQLDSKYTYELLLVYGQMGSDGIIDLLFQSRSKQIAALSSPAFEEALAILKNKYGSLIAGIRKDIVTDFGQRAFNNYLDSNAVDMAFVPENASLFSRHKNSLDLVPLIRRSKIEVIMLEVEDVSYNAERGKLAALFAGSVSAQ